MKKISNMLRFLKHRGDGRPGETLSCYGISKRQ